MLNTIALWDRPPVSEEPGCRREAPAQGGNPARLDQDTLGILLP